MRVRLYQLDGRVNLALMRISAHHRALGDEVEFRRAGNDSAMTAAALERDLTDRDPDLVYASLIFTSTRPLAERLRTLYPRAIVGGTGWDFGKPISQRTTCESLGITAQALDYSLYPHVTYSLGFTQRGCRLACSFCDVPKAEPTLFSSATIADVWRGDPHARHVLLMDNDPLGNPEWRTRFAEIREGGFRVCFNQGFNARMINRDHAAEIASIDYRASDFQRRCLYVAWDNRADERPLMRGLGFLRAAGVNPRHLTVYVLVGYDHETRAARPLNDDDFHRVRELRAFGAVPYPMPYVRPAHKRCERECCALGRSLLGFARWTAGAYDKPSRQHPQGVSWREWEDARYQPRGLGPKIQSSQGLMFIPPPP